MKKSVVLCACQVFVRCNIRSECDKSYSIFNYAWIAVSEYFICSDVEEKSSVYGVYPVAGYCTLKRLKFNDYSEWKRRRLCTLWCRLISSALSMSLVQ
jgi:hypothetical protein